MTARMVLLLACAWLLISCGGSGDKVGGAGEIDLPAFEAELASLSCPDGVDPALWLSLKDEFRTVMDGLAAQHAVADAPETDLSAVSDFAVTANPDGTATLAWAYRNQGDYNQDKLVAVTDLTEVGRYFEVGQNDPDWDKAQLADGNNDGRVTVSDITPLGVNYERRVEGYRISVGGTPGVAGNWQPLASIPFTAGAIPEGQQRLRFTFAVEEPVDGAYYRVAPYDGEHTGIAGNSAQFNSVAPAVTVHVPEAMLGSEEAIWSASWTQGTPPYEISWEFGGGAEDIGPVEATSPDEQTAVMINDDRVDSADYSYTVTVIDDYGLTGTAIGDYTVGPDPHPLVSVTVPPDMAGSLDADWTAQWIGGIPPYEISWVFGGGGADIGPIAASSPDNQTVAMVNESRSDPAAYTYVVTVTDAQGWDGIAEGEYTVEPDPHPLVTVDVPAAMSGGQDATWSASWIGGIPPYEISWDFGGGAEDAGPLQAASPAQHEATMINDHFANDAQYSYLVEVTDDEGMSGTASGDYAVGPGPNVEPFISDATFKYVARLLTVKAGDPNDGETLTVTVTEPPGLHADSTDKQASTTGPLQAVFLWEADDVSLGGTGTTTITVEDTLGLTASTDVEITIPARGTLYAIPQTETAAVDEPVTILVTTDVPGYPFEDMCMVSIVVEYGAELVGGSFNAGAIGGSSSYPDGIWAAMSPTSLFTSGGNWHGDNGDGRERWEFCIHPVGGADLTGESGHLFNFQFSFSTPGTYTLGFQDMTGAVKRTFYSDYDEYEQFWGDISNDHDGIPNSIVVVE